MHTSTALLCCSVEESLVLKIAALEYCTKIASWPPPWKLDTEICMFPFSKPSYASPAVGFVTFFVIIFVSSVNIMMSTVQDVQRRYLTKIQDQACGHGNRGLSDNTKPIGLKPLSKWWIPLEGAIAATAYLVLRNVFS
jgi:hypothetical protein